MAQNKLLGLIFRRKEIESAKFSTDKLFTGKIFSTLDDRKNRLKLSLLKFSSYAKICNIIPLTTVTNKERISNLSQPGKKRHKLDKIFHHQPELVPSITLTGNYMLLQQNHSGSSMMSIVLHHTLGSFQTSIRTVPQPPAVPNGGSSWHEKGNRISASLANMHIHMYYRNGGNFCAC